MPEHRRTAAVPGAAWAAVVVVVAILLGLIAREGGRPPEAPLGGCWSVVLHDPRRDVEVYAEGTICPPVTALDDR